MKKKTGDFDLESFITQLETLTAQLNAVELFLNLIRKDPKQIDTDIDRAKLAYPRESILSRMLKPWSN